MIAGITPSSNCSIIGAYINAGKTPALIVIFRYLS